MPRMVLAQAVAMWLLVVLVVAFDAPWTTLLMGGSTAAVWLAVALLVDSRQPPQT